MVTAQRFGGRELQLINCTRNLNRARVIQRGTQQFFNDLFTDRETGELEELWDVRIFQITPVEDVHEAPAGCR
jgi:hypothetical protein